VDGGGATAFTLQQFQFCLCLFFPRHQHHSVFLPVFVLLSSSLLLDLLIIYDTTIAKEMELWFALMLVAAVFAVATLAAMVMVGH